MYIRGEAYLAGAQGSAAAAELQKTSTTAGSSRTAGRGPLARLGVALQSRTFHGQGQGADADTARVRALAAYKDFLALWKDADCDTGPHFGVEVTCSCALAPSY